jgi:hypothetical protein
VACLPFGHQLGHGADRVLDGCVRVDPVLVVQVDVIRAQPTQRPFDRGTDVRGAAVEIAWSAAGMGDHSELCRHHYLVATALDGSPDEFLVGVRPVDLGGVDERHTEVERAMDRADGLGIVATRPGIAERHPHRTQTDAGHVQVSEIDVLHRYSNAVVHAGVTTM